MRGKLPYPAPIAWDYTPPCAMASIPLSQGGILKASCEVTLLFAACNTLELVEIAQLRYRVAALRRGARRKLSRTVRQYRQRFWRRRGWRCGWLRVNPIQIAKSFEFDNCLLHRRFAVDPAVFLDVFQYSFLIFLGALKTHALICGDSRVGFRCQFVLCFDALRLFRNRVHHRLVVGFIRRHRVIRIELGIGFVPWSPLGQGFLTGKIDASTKFESTNFRAIFPRFTEEARNANQAVVDLLHRIARRKNAAPAQIALAWLLGQKEWIVPIPGTTKVHRLEENIGAATVELTSDDLREIDAAASKIPIQGERLPESIL